MNSTLSNLFIFAAGAAIGSVVTWKLLKTKYKRIADEEIESVKEAFSRRTETDFDEVEEDGTDENSGLSDTLNKLGYKSYSDVSKPDEKEVPDVDKPYVISPDEFGECDYETVSLTYYADGVLADDFDNVVEDVDGQVGLESLNHFGEYEDDAVYVRNNDMQVDFEILLDVRNYDDLTNTSPNLTEDE